MKLKLKLDTIIPLDKFNQYNFIGNNLYTSILPMGIIGYRIRVYYVE